MPEPNRIGENINYRAIEQTMLRYTQNSPYERMTWLDRDYRKVIISHGSSPHYDDPDRNQVGRPVKAEAGGIEVVHSFRPYVSPIFEPQPTVFEEGCGALLQHVSAASL